MVSRAMVQVAQISRTVVHMAMKNATMEIVLITMDARVVRSILGTSVLLGEIFATLSVETDTSKLKMALLL